MKKYTKGTITPPIRIGGSWEAGIDCEELNSFWHDKIAIYEKTEKEAKRLRKIILKALKAEDSK